MLHLFGQLKSITRQWMNTSLVCMGSTYPSLLMYRALTDMACNKITAYMTRALEGMRPINALLDPYNPEGTTTHVRFNTSRPEAWSTPHSTATPPAPSTNPKPAASPSKSSTT
jgi:type III restriction enzyme